jgi:hypothetical protein
MMRLGVELVFVPLYRAEMGCLGDSSRELLVCMFRVEFNVDKSNRNVNLTLEGTTKAQRGCRGIAALFL